MSPMFLQYVFQNRSDLGGATLIVANGMLRTLGLDVNLGMKRNELDIRSQGHRLCGIHSM